MFRAPLCPSSGAWEYYTVVCSLWSLVLGFQVVGMVWSWGLCVRFAGCCFKHTTLSSTPYRQLEIQAPKTTSGNQLYNTSELLMMGIMVPETCCTSNKICNKKHLLHLVGISFPHPYPLCIPIGCPSTPYKRFSLKSLRINSRISHSTSLNIWTLCHNLEEYRSNCWLVI
jgi:hypothetical protein